MLIWLEFHFDILSETGVLIILFASAGGADFGEQSRKLPTAVFAYAPFDLGVATFAPVLFPTCRFVFGFASNLC